jgi:hypothetical protein
MVAGGSAFAADERYFRSISARSPKITARSVRSSSQQSASLEFSSLRMPQNSPIPLHPVEIGEAEHVGELRRVEPTGGP